MDNTPVGGLPVKLPLAHRCRQHEFLFTTLWKAIPLVQSLPQSLGLLDALVQDAQPCLLSCHRRVVQLMQYLMPLQHPFVHLAIIKPSQLQEDVQRPSVRLEVAGSSGQQDLCAPVVRPVHIFGKANRTTCFQRTGALRAQQRNSGRHRLDASPVLLGAGASRHFQAAQR